MSAWEKDQKVDGSKMLTMLADTRGELTKALGMVMDHPGPMSVLGNPRCKRFSMLIINGIIKTINLAEAEGDPAGDDKPDVSLVEKMLVDLKGMDLPTLKKESGGVSEDAEGCFDKGEGGLWCPDGSGGWVDKKSGKSTKDMKGKEEL